MNRAVIFMGSARMDRAARTRRNCSTEFDGDHCIEFREPEPVRFGKALTYIKCVQRSNLPTLVALDQPTIVRNADGMRPLDRVVAGLISWTGRRVHTLCPGPLALWRVSRADARGSGWASGTIEPRWREAVFTSCHECCSSIR